MANMLDAVFADNCRSYRSVSPGATIQERVDREYIRPSIFTSM